MNDTKMKILQSGKAQFLLKGFKGAAMRTIAANAGYTFGALYGYFDSKEELFYAITSETANGITSLINRAKECAMALPPEERIEGTTRCFAEVIPELIEYMFERKDDLALIITRSEGTKYDTFLETIRVDDGMFKIPGEPDKAISSMSMALLTNGFLSMIVWSVLQGKSIDEVKQSAKEIARVYDLGVKAVLHES